MCSCRDDSLKKLARHEAATTGGHGKEINFTYVELLSYEIV